MDPRVAPTNHLFDVIVAIVLGVAVVATVAKISTVYPNEVL